MGKLQVSRPTRFVAVVVMTLVVLVVGVKIAYVVSDDVQNAKAFAALRTIDRRVDLAHSIPHARRSEGGQAVNFTGGGPYILYTINSAVTPDWKKRFYGAMYKGGFSRGGEPWSAQVRDYEVLIDSTPPGKSNNLAYIAISTT